MAFALSVDGLLGEGLVVEVLDAQRLEGVRRPRRVHEIAGEHRVEARAGNNHAVPRHHDGVVLHVVANLLDALVLEQGGQGPERAALVEVAHFVERAVAQRHVPRMPGAARKGDAHDDRAHGICIVADDAHAGPPGPARGLDLRGQLVERRDDGVVGGGGGCRRGEVAGEARKPRLEKSA